MNIQFIGSKFIPSGISILYGEFWYKWGVSPRERPLEAKIKKNTWFFHIVRLILGRTGGFSHLKDRRTY